MVALDSPADLARSPHRAHRNGHVVADSGEGYASKQKAKQGVESVRSNTPTAAIEDATVES